MTIPEDAVQAVAQMLYDWNIERPTTRDVIAAYQEWMRSTGHVPDEGFERAGTIGRTPDHRWFWTSSEDFEFWGGPAIETQDAVYRRVRPSETSQ